MTTRSVIYVNYCSKPDSMIQRLIILHLNIHEWSFPKQDSTTTTEVAGEEDKDGTPSSSYSSNDEPSRLPQQQQHHHHQPYNAENASIEELQIPILYYYDKDENDDDNNRNSTAGGGSSSSHQSIVNRIQFAGLCQALYHLPTTIHTILSPNTTASTTSNDEMNDNHDEIQTVSPTNDRTKMVQYDSDTALVFVPLTTTTTTTTILRNEFQVKKSKYHNTKQKNVDIVAVIQICTFTPTATSSSSSSVSQSFSSSTPYAMEKAIQRTYLQFCLLRNGTIHERLLHPRNRNTNDNHHLNDDCYPGMDQLYLYYQQQQRQRQYNHKNDYNDACYMKGRALIIVLYFCINFTLFN